MRTPLESYAPVSDNGPPLGPEGGDRFRWLQWLQLALTAALLVMFFNQLSQLQDANRRIARLYDRLDALDSTRMLDSPTLAAQQALIIKRLQALEARVHESESAGLDSSESSETPAALQAPRRP